MRRGQDLLVTGFTDDRFLPVRDTFEELFAAGAENGASLAIHVEGRLVVDLRGGTAAVGSPWRPDTRVHTYSVTKPFAAACLG
jgi:CubicO group peptidase (beta-lactamase class C family)